MSAHTPGPWTTLRGFPTRVVPAAHANLALGGSVYAADDRSNFATIIASATYDDWSGPEFSHRIRRPEAEANARLIAAAPEMLAALKRAAEYLIETITAQEGAAVLEAVDAAIALAEGRQP